jgi:hypothetical protein
MALRKNFQVTKAGFSGVLVSNDAYIKVESVSGTKLNVCAEISIFSQDNELIEKIYRSFTPNLDGGNFIAQAYFHLKTLPEFAGATDC